MALERYSSQWAVLRRDSMLTSRPLDVSLQAPTCTGTHDTHHSRLLLATLHSRSARGLLLLEVAEAQISAMLHLLYGTDCHSAHVLSSRQNGRHILQGQTIHTSAALSVISNFACPGDTNSMSDSSAYSSSPCIELGDGYARRTVSFVGC